MIRKIFTLFFLLFFLATSIAQPPCDCSNQSNNKTDRLVALIINDPVGAKEFYLNNKNDGFPFEIKELIDAIFFTNENGDWEDFNTIKNNYYKIYKDYPIERNKNKGFFKGVANIVGNAFTLKLKKIRFDNKQYSKNEIENFDRVFWLAKNYKYLNCLGKIVENFSRNPNYIKWSGLSKKQAVVVIKAQGTKKAEEDAQKEIEARRVAERNQRIADSLKAREAINNLSDQKKTETILQLRQQNELLQNQYKMMKDIVEIKSSLSGYKNIHPDNYEQFINAISDTLIDRLQPMLLYKALPCDSLRSYVELSINKLKKSDYKIDNKTLAGFLEKKIIIDTLLDGYDKEAIEIPANKIAVLDKIIDSLVSNPKYQVLIIGYSSTEQYSTWCNDYAIANSRCYFIKDYFESHFIRNQITTQTYGRSLNKNLRGVRIKVIKTGSN